MKVGPWCERRLGTRFARRGSLLLPPRRWTPVVLAFLLCELLQPAAAHASDRITSFAPSSGFASRSYWNGRLPDGVPLAANSRQIIGWLIAHSDNDFVTLAGTSPTGQWGMPIYWPARSDPAYRVRNSCSYVMPPEFSSVRIPKGARPDPTSDGAMTVYDTQKGIAYGLFHARYDAGSGAWSSCGGSVYYLSSNGLDGALPQSDRRDNFGHRGIPPNVFAVTRSEVRTGAIHHVLKISVPETKCAHVFPMVGDECGTNDAYAPPEGTRIRIRRHLDLRKLGLSRPALVVARALKWYGAVIGDQSGGSVSLKVENTVAEGRGWKWRGVLASRSLAKVPLRDFVVIRPGYGA